MRLYPPNFTYPGNPVKQKYVKRPQLKAFARLNHTTILRLLQRQAPQQAERSSGGGLIPVLPQLYMCTTAASLSFGAELPQKGFTHFHAATEFITGTVSCNSHWAQLLPAIKLFCLHTPVNLHPCLARKRSLRSRGESRSTWLRRAERSCTDTIALRSPNCCPGSTAGGKGKDPQQHLQQYSNTQFTTPLLEDSVGIFALPGIAGGRSPCRGSPKGSPKSCWKKPL